MVIPEVEQELEKEAERKSVVLFGIEVSEVYSGPFVMLASFLECSFKNKMMPTTFLLVLLI